MSQKEKSKSTTSTGLAPWQTQIGEELTKTYSPYIGAGTLGGLSDLEEGSLNMLRSADIWGPLTTAGTGLLTGQFGAQPITPESASRTFESAVVNPALKDWEETWKPGIKEEYAGPGYWGSARAKAVTEGAEDLGDWLGGERANWMWNAEQANRSIEEAKAGRALSALGAVPSSLLNWTSGLFGTGTAAREIMNQITDPEVMQTLQFILNKQFAPVTTRGVSAPSEFDQAKAWRDVGGSAAMSAISGGGLGGALGGLLGG